MHLSKALPIFLILLVTSTGSALAQASKIVDTGQDVCFDDRSSIPCPAEGQDFHGQDAQHQGHQASYMDHGDGTVSDLVTGLMWQKTPAYGWTYREARDRASTATTGGYDDWRLPTLKELYSLIDFRGVTGRGESDSRPYLDTAYFDFEYGHAGGGARFIDAQYCSSTEYVEETMGGNATVFGVNFADGRIKGYPIRSPRGEKTFHVRYVRGVEGYGENQLVDHGNRTISDEATGLMWSQFDSGRGLDWESALAFVAEANTDRYLGYDDWRLPNAKELQSLVDYRRSPGTTSSAAIDPIFSVTSLGDGEFPYFWTSTTHLDGPPGERGSAAVYLSFGRGLGFFRPPRGSGGARLMDVHGAGSQRSDPKSGSASAFPRGRGPQGDVIRIENFVRLVRDDESVDAYAFRGARLPGDA